MSQRTPVLIEPDVDRHIHTQVAAMLRHEDDLVTQNYYLGIAQGLIMCAAFEAGCSDAEALAVSREYVDNARRRIISGLVKID